MKFCRADERETAKWPTRLHGVLKYTFTFFFYKNKYNDIISYWSDKDKFSAIKSTFGANLTNPHPKNDKKNTHQGHIKIFVSLVAKDDQRRTHHSLCNRPTLSGSKMAVTR